MSYKIDIAVREGKDKGRTFHIESESQAFVGMKIGDAVNGKEIKPELAGYEFTITGASDKAGFPALQQIEGTTQKRVLLGYGRGMRHKRPDGIRLRKRVHGNTISGDIVQINLAMKKQGARLLSEIFGKTEEKESGSVEGKKEESKEKPKE